MTLTLSAADRARVAEITALGEIVPPAVDTLVVYLDDRSWPVRRAAVAALARAGPPAVPVLVQILQSRRDNEARLAAAVDALAGSTADVAPALLKLTDGAAPPVICDVAQVRGRRKSTFAVFTLAGWVGHDDDNVSVAAIEALGRIGAGAGLDAVIGAATSGRFFRVHAAIDVLARSGDARAIPPLEALLEHPVSGPDAARALARIGDLATVSALSRRLAGTGASMTRLTAVSLSLVVDTLGTRFGVRDGALAAMRAAVVDPNAVIESFSQAISGSDAEERLAMARVLSWLALDGSAAILVQLLRDGGEVARASAAALTAVGKEGQHALLSALRTGTTEDRALVLPLLTTAARNAEEVALCLEDPDAGVRTLACATIARIGSTASLPALFAVLDDVSPAVVQAAITAIQGLGHASIEPLSLQAAASPSATVRRAGLRLLGAFGFASGLEPLVAASKGTDERLAEAAIASLAYLEAPQAGEALFELSRSPKERVRAAALRALGLRGATEDVVARLEEGLTDPAPWVRYYAAQALGRVPARADVAKLARLLDDAAGFVRVAAVEALSHVPAPEAVLAITSAVGSDDPDLRRAALVGLGIGRAPGAAAALLAALNDPDPSTRMVAAGSLVGFGDEEVVAALVRSAQEASPEVRRAALGALAATPGRAATRALFDLGKDDADALAALATPALGRIPALLEIIEVADAPTAVRVTTVLSRMKRPEARAALTVALVMPLVPTRRAAAAALAVLAAPDTASSLEHARKSDPDPEVRRLAAHGLTDT